MLFSGFLALTDVFCGFWTAITQSLLILNGVVKHFYKNTLTFKREKKSISVWVLETRPYPNV